MFDIIGRLLELRDELLGYADRYGAESKIASMFRDEAAGVQKAISVIQYEMGMDPNQ